MRDDGVRTIRAFLRRLDDGAASRRLASPLGTVLVNDDYPHSLANNFLRVEGPRPLLTAPQLAAEAERALNTAGRSRLQVIIEDEATGARLAEDLRALGWTVEHDVAMTWEHEPDRPPGVRAEVVSWEAIRPVILRHTEEEPWAVEPEIARQVVDRRAAIGRAIPLRVVAAPAGGPYAAHADLYTDGHTAQIESVFTLSEARNRGLSRAVVLHAAGLARAEGHRLVFLIADQDDWPRHLYARLGFEPLFGFWDCGRDD